MFQLRETQNTNLRQGRREEKEREKDSNKENSLFLVPENVQVLSILSLRCFKTPAKSRLFSRRNCPEVSAQRRLSKRLSWPTRDHEWRGLSGVQHSAGWGFRRQLASVEEGANRIVV